MKVAVYVFILFTVLLSCVEAQFKKNIMHSLLSQKQSTSDCRDILPEMCIKPIQEKINATNTDDIQDISRTLNFTYSIICGADCNDEYIRFYECDGDDEMIEETRGAFCAVNDDDEFCAVVLFDGVASGRISSDSCEDCETDCDFVEYLSSFLGCCAASFARFDFFIDARDCNTVDLGEPCSGSSLFATLGTITLAVIAVLTLF